MKDERISEEIAKRDKYIRRNTLVDMLRKLYPEAYGKIQGMCFITEELEQLLVVCTYDLKQRLEAAKVEFRKRKQEEERLRKAGELFPQEKKYLSKEEYRLQWRKDYLQSLSSK